MTDQHEHTWRLLSWNAAKVLEGCRTCPATRTSPAPTGLAGALCIRGQCPSCRRTVNLADHPSCPGRAG